MSDYSSDEYDDDEPEFVPITLEECGGCGRKFNPDALARHQNICNNVNKPRKVFDSRKQRLEQLAKDGPPSKSTPIPEKKTPKKKDWRRQHQEFIKTIRAARGVTAAQKSGAELPPPPSPTINPDYIQCQYCNRRFNESAAERHINFCKEQKSRLPKQSADSKFSVKKEKQAKRTQYRPPLPGQKKKSVDSQSPAKPRSYASSPGNKPDSSPSPARRIPSGSSDKKAQTYRKKKPLEQVQKVDMKDERPLSNSRYSKSKYSSPTASDSDSSSKPKSGKSRNGDPKWFEDLKRHDSAGQSRHQRESKYDNDEMDSGMDLNDNFSGRYGSAESRKGRPTQNGVSDRLSAGRRKMANFCHDCGTKYPVSNAKFCCECGIQRMALT